MRHIDKSKTPEFWSKFVESCWKTQFEDWRDNGFKLGKLISPTYKSAPLGDNKHHKDSLGNILLGPKKQLWNHLLLEQKGVCCYCQRIINPNLIEIEHFIQQSIFPELSLNYRNLFAVCSGANRDDSKPIEKNNTAICHTSKELKRNHILHFILLDKDCSNYFHFDKKTGEMSVNVGFINPRFQNSRATPSHDRGFVKLLEGLIDILNLNESFLMGERKRAIQDTISYVRMLQNNGLNLKDAVQDALKAIETQNLDFPSARIQALGM